MKHKYDYLFITNVPAFYKINLYNKLSEKSKIKVIFVSKTSKIRPADFSKGSIKFECEYLTEADFEDRNKLSCFIKFLKIILSSRFSYLVYPGWELIELLPFLFILPKNKNAMQIESSINETKTDGFVWYLKKKFIRRVGLAFPSGVLQKDILKLASFKGEIRITHGVGLLDRNRSRNLPCDNRFESFRYLYVGRVSKEKNLNFLIDEFNKNGKLLTIVGNGPQLNELKAKSRDNITYLGYVSNSELNDIYLSHSAFILPSLSEPWGLVIDEALWCGLPVIVSNKVGCLQDLVVKPASGCVFNLDDYQALRLAIENIENNYEKFRKNVLDIDFKIRDEEQISAYEIESFK